MSDQLACHVQDIPLGGAIRADLTQADGRDVPVAVIRTADGEVYAIGDTCSHGEVSLSEGDLHGYEIECWGHGAFFDVRDGSATELPALRPVPAYPVRIDGERVLVDVDAPISAKENA